ncbi:hypothetical protein [Sorangium sp. So ce131]|uniref:hypothetical protein n=1 Tax=Sorangium sp. So ce131 TaxID=3133282 RepID=UPI003F621A5B
MLDGTRYRVLPGARARGAGEGAEAEPRGLRRGVVVTLVHRALACDPRFADRGRLEGPALVAVSSPHGAATPPPAARGGARNAAVLDLDVARLLPGAAPPLLLAGPAYPTQGGCLVGTPRTASPGRGRCVPVDDPADVYAVGLLLYTLVVGRGSFAHVEDALDLLHADVRETPAPPSRHAAQRVLPALDRAVLKALAKRPEHRFQGAEAARRGARAARRLAAGRAACGAGGGVGPGRAAVRAADAREYGRRGEAAPADRGSAHEGSGPGGGYRPQFRSLRRRVF